MLCRRVLLRGEDARSEARVLCREFHALEFCERREFGRAARGALQSFGDGREFAVEVDGGLGAFWKSASERRLKVLSAFVARADAHFRRVRQTHDVGGCE